MRTKIAAISLVGLFIIAGLITAVQIGDNQRYDNHWTMPSFRVFMPMDKALGAPDTYVGGGALILPASSYSSCTDLGGGICVVNGGWQIANPVVPEVVFTNLDVNTLTPGTGVCAGTGGKLQSTGCAAAGGFTALAGAKSAIDDSVSSQGTFYGSVSQYTNAVLTDSPTALYETQDFDKSLTGGAIDSSQNLNAGTYCITGTGFSGCTTTPTTTMTARAAGLTVDGRSMQSTCTTTNCPFITTPITVSVPFTIEAWINFPDVSTRVGGDTIATNRAVAQGMQFDTDSTDSALRMIIEDSGGTPHTLESVTAISNSTTYFVVATVDGSGNTKLYINGVLDNSGALAVPGTSGTISLHIGGGDNGNDGWKGKMSDISYYTKVLTAQQILSHYHAGFGDWPYLQDLTNTKIAAAPTDQDVLTWVNADSKWENKSVAAAGGVTSVSGVSPIVVTAGATPAVSCPTCATGGGLSQVALAFAGAATPSDGGLTPTSEATASAPTTQALAVTQVLHMGGYFRETTTGHNPGICVGASTLSTNSGSRYCFQLETGALKGYTNTSGSSGSYAALATGGSVSESTGWMRFNLTIFVDALKNNAIMWEVWQGNGGNSGPPAWLSKQDSAIDLTAANLVFSVHTTTSTELILNEEWVDSHPYP